MSELINCFSSLPLRVKRKVNELNSQERKLEYLANMLHLISNFQNAGKGFTQIVTSTLTHGLRPERRLEHVFTLMPEHFGKSAKG